MDNENDPTQPKPQPPRNPPIFNNPPETEEIKRLRKVVEDSLGAEPWEVIGTKAGPDGELQLQLKKKES